VQPVIVDTNVPIVANQNSEQASPACVQACSRKLQEIQQGRYILVIDDQWKIISEYKHRLNQSGQPGVGDAFLKWVLTNWMNPTRCVLISIIPQADTFAEIPTDPILQTFDPSDRKFLAVAFAHPQKPPILNAVDTDWWHFQHVFSQYGLRLEFLCPDAMQNPQIIPPLPL
jgi:hypothetical protein